MVKECIVEVVVVMIFDGVFLFINIGMIIEFIVKKFFNYKNFYVVINNIYVVIILFVKEDFLVIIVVGEVCYRDGGIIGEVICDFIS